MKKNVLTVSGIESVSVIDQFSMFGQVFFTYHKAEEDSIHVIDAYSGYSVCRIDWMDCCYFLDLSELSTIIIRRAKELLQKKRHEFFELRYSCLLEEIGSTNPINTDYEKFE